MHHAVADKLGVFKRRYHGKHPLLLAPGQVGLKADNIINSALGVVLSQLHHGVGFRPGAGIHQSHRLQGPISQGILAPSGHDLHRHTAFKHAPVVKAVDLRLLCGGELTDKGRVLVLCHGAVYIISGALAVSGGEKGRIHIHAVQSYYGRHGVVEVQVECGTELFYALGHGVAGEGACGHHHLPVGDVVRLFFDDFDAAVAAYLLRDIFCEALSVHSQRAAGGDPGLVRGLHYEGAHSPQLGLQEPHRVCKLVRAQRVGAHELPKIRGNVSRGHFVRLHFHQCHGYISLSQLPGTFTAGQSGADHCYFFHVLQPIL